MQKYTTRDFDRDFPDDGACLDWLLNARWPDGVTCGQCQRVTKHFRITGRPCYSCEFCGTHVYPMAGTIFQDSRTPLRLWFRAIDIMAVTKCGVSSRALSRDLGVTVKTGYRMWYQIRQILAEDGGSLTGKVEADETYIGGKRKGKRGRGAAGKTIVFGMVERNGRVVAKVVPNVKAATLLPEIEKRVKAGTSVYTDDLASYNRLSQMGFSQLAVAHSQGVYVTGEDIHTNTIEGFWSQLKRSIDGTYHHVTPEHLPDYVNEYSFRYTHRNDGEPMFQTMLGQVVRHASSTRGA